MPSSSLYYTVRDMLNIHNYCLLFCVATRSKSGIWGWRSDKNETVNTYECKVFSASNVELVTKTRTEHLTDQDKQKCKRSSSKTPLESFLGMAEQEEKLQGATNGVSAAYLNDQLF